MNGSTLKTSNFDKNTLVRQLEPLMKEIKPEWGNILFLSDSGDEVNSGQLKGHPRLAVKGHTAREENQGRVKRMRRCREFEAAQLINLMPGSVEEAAELIPTLKGNGFLSGLVEEIQTWKVTDRGIGSMMAMERPGYNQ